MINDGYLVQRDVKFHFESFLIDFGSIGITGSIFLHPWTGLLDKSVYLRGQIYQSELTRLTSSLPSGIHLRCYESRCDLFSFLIEGPTDTPYRFCLFTFDIALPMDYPLSPPKVTYRSTINHR